MTGRYKISMVPLLDNGTPRAWESEKRTAQRWHLFADTCRSLAADGLDYTVTFALTSDALLAEVQHVDAELARRLAGPLKALCTPVSTDNGLG